MARAANPVVFVAVIARGDFLAAGVWLRGGPVTASSRRASAAWGGKRPWSTGRVGTMGTSYLAWVPRALAILAPPHLRALWVHEGIAYAAKAKCGEALPLSSGG